MNKVKYRITLDLERPGVQHTIYAKRGDALSREVVFTLRAGSKAYRIDEGTSAFLYAKADGAEIFTDCEVSGSMITAELTTNMLSAKDILLELRLADASGAVLATPQVKVIAEDTLYSEDAITATNDFSALLNAITRAENARIVDITAEGKVITITYADGQTISVEVDVEDGFSPVIRTKEVENGSNIIITDIEGETIVFVANGRDGKDGQNGADGFSPIISVEDITGGHKVSITDKSGTKAFDVMDGKGGAGGGGDTIIDVIELPTADINEDAFYRLLTGTFVYNQYTQSNFICHCVETLPDAGYPALSGDLSDFANATVTAYYNVADGSVNAYVTSELSAVFGVPAGWYPASILLAAVGQQFSGVITDINDDPQDSTYRLLLEYVTYSYKDGWTSYKTIGREGAGHSSEVFNHPNNQAYGHASHAEGIKTATGSREEAGIGYGAHAEGFGTTAVRDGAHSEGVSTTASGYASHAEGEASHAEGEASHAEGEATHAAGRSQHTQGEYNIIDPDYDVNNPYVRGRYAHIVGNGTNDNNRSNAHTLDWEGNAEYQGDVKAMACGGANPISLVELAERVEQGGGGAPADWNASEGEAGHVLNRTHYALPDEILVSNADIVAGEDGEMYFEITPLSLPMSEYSGKKFAITLNGVEYTRSPLYLDEDSGEMLFLGNYEAVLGTGDNGDTFVLGIGINEGVYMGVLFMLDGSTSARISVTVLGDCKELDKKFIRTAVHEILEGDTFEFIATNDDASEDGKSGSTQIITTENLVERALGKTCHFNILLEGERYDFYPIFAREGESGRIIYSELPHTEKYSNAKKWVRFRMSYIGDRTNISWEIFDYADWFVRREWAKTFYGCFLMIGSDGNIVCTDPPQTGIDKNSITLGVHTDGLVYVFVDGTPCGTGISMAAGGDVVGNVDENNVITLTGNLTNGTYTFKYVNVDGSTTTIGTAEVTDGGEEELPYTNQIPISTDKDGSVYGYTTGTYLSSSTGEVSTRANSETTGFIPVKIGDVIRLDGVGFNKTASDTGYHRMCFYDADKNFLNFQNVVNLEANHETEFDASGNMTKFVVKVYGDFVPSTVAYIRLCCPSITDESVITVNEEIV
jgi:hypothetical protein